MYLYCDRGNWYLYQQQKDKNDKWFKRTVATFGKTKPVFQIPFVYRGCAEDLVGAVKNKTADLILTDPPYGLTQNPWDVLPNWKENAKEYERVLKDNGLIAIFGTIPNIITVYNVFMKYFSFRFDITWIKGKRTSMWSSHNLPKGFVLR